MTGGQQVIRFVVIPIVSVMSLGITLVLCGYDRAGTVVSNGGTALWLLGVFWWIVLVDSRKRWPGVSWQQRATRVMTFHRDRP